MIVRNADAKRDATACAAIYAPHVEHTVASFEIQAPSADEMAARIETAFAWVIAEDQHGTLGYAYGSSHRERAAYRWAGDVALEIDANHRPAKVFRHTIGTDSAGDVAVYIGAEHHRRGVGRALYTELFKQLRELGLWTLCAGITLPNAASTGLHSAMGFEPVGIYRRIGWKRGAWHDVQWWQLDLRPDESGPPAEPAITAPAVRPRIS